MSKYNILKANFSGGEISPKAEADLQGEVVANGVALFENFTSYKSGGGSKRLGTEFLEEFDLPEVHTDINDSTKTTRGVCSIPFVISSKIGMAIHVPLGPLTYISKVNSSNANYDGVLNPSVPMSESLDSSGFRFNQISDIVIITHISGRMSPKVVALVSLFGSTYSFRMYEFYDINNYTSLKAITLRYPYLDPNISTTTLTSSATIKFAPTTITSGGESLFSARSIGKRYKLTHSGVTGSFKITRVASLEQTALGTDVVYATDTIVLASHGYVDGDAVYFMGKPTADFIVDDIYYIRKISSSEFKISTTLENLEHDKYVDLVSGASANIIMLKDGVYVSTCTGLVEETIGATTGTDNWEEVAWSIDRGWPKLANFYEGRSIWMGTTSDTDTVWCSLTGDIYHMMGRKFEQDSSADVSGLNYFGALSSTDAFFFSIAGSDTPIIQWLSIGKVIQAGTIGQEFIISGGGSALSALPGTISVTSHSSNGSTDVNTVRSERSVIYVSSDGQNLRSYKYNDANGSYTSSDLSLFADEIVMNHGGNADGLSYTSAKIIQSVYQQSTNIVWMLTSNNVLISMTYNKESDTGSWSRHTIAGTDIKIISILAIPSESGTLDELVIVAERTINGAAVTYIERMRSKFENIVLTSGDIYSKSDAPFFSDSSKMIIETVATKTFTLAHLANETVAVLADGAYVGDFLADGSGVITLNNVANKVIAGLKYKAKIRSTNVSGSGDFGTPEGNKQRIDRIFLRVLRSLGGLFGSSEDNLNDIEYEFGEDNKMFTGGLSLEFGGDNEEISRFYIEHDEPLPFNLLSVTTRGVNHD